MFSKRKGQSAIEYLTTYGWMLLVIAIVGGAIFTTVQNSSQIQSTSGLANADVQVEEFGVNDQGMQAEVRAASTEQIENLNVSIINEETGEAVRACSKTTIPVASTDTVNLKGVESSDNTNTFDVEVVYDSGGLEDLTETGTITGKIELNSSISCNPVPSPMTTSDFTVT